MGLLLFDYTANNRLKLSVRFAFEYMNVTFASKRFNRSYLVRCCPIYLLNSTVGPVRIVFSHSTHIQKMFLEHFRVNKSNVE